MWWCPDVWWLSGTIVLVLLAFWAGRLSERYPPVKEDTKKNWQTSSIEWLCEQQGREWWKLCQLYDYLGLEQVTIPSSPVTYEVRKRKKLPKKEKKK